MHFLDLTLPDLPSNLALDEALLLHAEDAAGRGELVPLLRFWEFPITALVLGAGCRLAEDVHEARCRSDSLPLARRASGGGTVLLGSGCLLYSLILPYSLHAALGDVRASYRLLLGKMAASLEVVLPGVEPAGISDVAYRGRKLSGNAQQRKRHNLLHHGSLLYDFDFALVERYLKLPARQPEYRGGRAHRDFLMNVPARVHDLKCRLRECWNAREELTAWPRDLAARLVEEKYGQESWTRRR
ncbi:MAG: lipoate--protein ligase family protein [Gemmataceae bacterium]|nr:lipoate--protein ligase family protein [Gemmataceae bacterium]MCI0742986.1 lipoate--protein ligase family protein [Gemmataceae bacterium]